MTTNATKMSRRSLLGLLGAGVAGTAAISLAGCSNDNTSGGGTGEPGTAQDFAFGSWSLSEEAARDVIEAQLDAFAEDAGVQISQTAYPFDEYLNQLTLQVRGGQFTGAAQLDIAWLSTIAAMDRLVDLGDYADGRGYTEAALAAGQVDGVQFGLPWTTGAIGLVANAEILAEVGADGVPATIEEFEELLRELKGLGDGLIPYAASTKVNQLKDVQVWMQAFGSPLLEDGRITIGDEASIEAVTWYKSLLDEGLIAADVDRFDARSLFAQGRAAIYEDAPVGRAGVVGDSPDGDLASKLQPNARPVRSAGATPYALAWGHTVVVVDGEGADTAAEFAQWLTSDESTVVSYFEDLGLPPSTEEGLASSAVLEDTFIADFGERITATATPSPFWVFPSYGQIDAVINERVQAALVGQQDVAEALSEAAEQAQDLIS